MILPDQFGAQEPRNVSTDSKIITLEHAIRANRLKPAIRNVLAARNAIGKKGGSVLEPSGEAIRANLRIDSRESSHLSSKVWRSRRGSDQSFGPWTSAGMAPDIRRTSVPKTFSLGPFLGHLLETILACRWDRSLGNDVRKNGVRNRCAYRRCGVDTDIPYRPPF